MFILIDEKTLRKQLVATSLPAQEDPFQLNPTESNCTQRTNLHHCPHTPTETKQKKDPEFPSNIPNSIISVAVNFTIPYTFYHPNQPNKSAPPKKTTKTDLF